MVAITDLTPAVGAPVCTTAASCRCARRDAANEAVSSAVAPLAVERGAELIVGHAAQVPAQPLDVVHADAARASAVRWPV